jgi:hypothetical protein
MRQSGRRLLAVAVVLLLAAPAARAADKCVAKATLGGKPVAFKHCAVALYDEQGFTLVLTEAPLSADEMSTFQMNSYPPERDANGKKRAILSLAFCPGGGKPTPSPAAVKSVEIAANDGSSPLGLQDVLALPAQKANLKIEKLSGDLKLGGRLAGKITGSKSVDQAPYSWDIDFDLALPAKGAAAGPGCGGS